MENLSRQSFDDNKYGCPCHRGEYGKACILLRQGCHYDDCPFVFWVNIIPNTRKELEKEE